MRRFAWICTAAAVALLAASCSSEDNNAAEMQYYLSLGDGLTVGAQPDDSGDVLETATGYTNLVASALSKEPPGVQHVNLGCIGETTITFLSGGAEGCEYDEGSQLDAAVEFLEQHKGKVRLITISIGGENLFSCARDEDGALTTDIDRECVSENLQKVSEDAPIIAQRLREAAGDDVEIIALTAYNPLLAMYLQEEVTEVVATEDDDERTYQDTANYTNGMLAAINGTLNDAYIAENITVANVATLFDVDNFEENDDGTPANVHNVCQYTWMCDTERGPDIHLNQEGAQEVATLVQDVMRE